VHVAAARSSATREATGADPAPCQARQPGVRESESFIYAG